MLHRRDRRGEGDHQSFERLLICSGQTANDADGNVQHAGDMRAQLDLVFDNIETLLTAAGDSWEDVVKMKWFTTDIDQLTQIDYAETRLGRVEIRAAQSVDGVTQLAQPGLMVEVEVTAAK